MATYGDDEQIEALKEWWKENGNSLLTGVLLVVAVFFGVRQWQSWQVSSNAAASDLYQQISELTIVRLGEPVSEQELLSSAQAVYSQLKNDYEKSFYTRYAALAMASFQVGQEQLDLAAQELQWVLDNPEGGFMREVPDELLLTARQRLARVKLAQGEAEAALDLLRAVDSGTQATSYAEVEGDALVALGQREQGRVAYERALAGMEPGTNPVALRLKLQDLGLSPVAVP